MKNSEIKVIIAATIEAMNDTEPTLADRLHGLDLNNDFNTITRIKKEYLEEIAERVKEMTGCKDW